MQVVASSNLAAPTNSNTSSLSRPTSADFALQSVFAGLFATAVNVAAAQAYPAHPVRVLSRLRPAASPTLPRESLLRGGIVASEAVAKAAPDAVSASLFKSLPYDAMRDFAPVSTVGFFDLALVIERAKIPKQ